MSSTFNKTARDLAQVLKKVSSQATSPYDTSAEVRRIEGDTAWVHIPGGVDETPVQLTTNAKKGDIVQVRVSGGRAWLYGNVTSPPTDDTKANEAKKTADVADEHATNAVTSALLAQQFADVAKDAAESAQADATIAKQVTDEITEYAETAEKSVTDILQDAENANIAAGEAKVAAGEAKESASVAQTHLSTIEDVVGVLEWIANHAIYAWTNDTTPEVGKWYYSLTATEVPAIDVNDFDMQSGKYYTRSINYSYVPVEAPDASELSTYYEYDSETETYFLTEDVSIDPEKTYYIRNSDYVYSVAKVGDPQPYYAVSVEVATLNENVNPHDEYYYEIESYDKTVRDYIYTYLSLDAGGLHLTDGDIGNRIDISTKSGVEIYNKGNKIAQYGANTIIGSTKSFHIEITPEQLSFVTGSNVVVAYMSGEVLNIPRVVVIDSMQIGKWLWDGKSNPAHLVLRWMGE